MFCGIKQKQFRLRELHVGKAQVEIRSHLGLGERANLVGSGLALGHGLLRHLAAPPARSAPVKGLIYGERDVELRGALVFKLRLGIRLSAEHQVVRAAEVGDQLAYRKSARGAIVRPTNWKDSQR